MPSYNRADGVIFTDITTDKWNISDQTNNIVFSYHYIYSCSLNFSIANVNVYQLYIYIYITSWCSTNRETLLHKLLRTTRGRQVSLSLRWWRLDWSPTLLQTWTTWKRVHSIDKREIRNYRKNLLILRPD